MFLERRVLLQRGARFLAWELIELGEGRRPRCVLHGHVANIKSRGSSSTTDLFVLKGYQFYLFWVMFHTYLREVPPRVGNIFTVCGI